MTLLPKTKESVVPGPGVGGISPRKWQGAFKMMGLFLNLRHNFMGEVKLDTG